ncbi:hypothetical protein ACEZ3G_06835 [Maribacter algicola]|uniref:Uncharacterized protein n=1 Tax=Meishania litoralis TaxID=3434685 RepID=A0ACC7LHL0_9FLAO
MFLVFLASCGTSKNTYEVRYEKAWKEVLKSQAWRDALRQDNGPLTAENNDFYASTDETEIVSGPAVDNKVYVDGFADKYDFLVHRAYAKIIAEAEMADSRLEKDYLDWNTQANLAEAQKDKSIRQKLEAVNERYKAHRKMLEGLKSWNIFSEFGTDDLDFFKAEHADEVRQMLQKGHGEGNVVGFLVYKLADLYHFEE